MESLSPIFFFRLWLISHYTEAFISRFSIAIKYNDLDRESRLHMYALTISYHALLSPKQMVQVLEASGDGNYSNQEDQKNGQRYRPR